ncbi:MAG: bL35 family ribosomal protein, partial [Lentisphaerota bacterium]
MPFCGPCAQKRFDKRNEGVMAKLKQKTKKAIAKRFKRTARGKILHARIGRGHLLSSKTRKRKRQLR